MIVPTELLRKMVTEITNLKRSNMMLIKFMFRNKQDPNYTLDNALVGSFGIRCDYMNNVTDDIRLTIKVTPKQLQQLITLQSDLYVDILIEYVDPYTLEILLDEKPIQLKYNVFIHDLSGLNKKLGVNAYENTEFDEDSDKIQRQSAYIPVEMQLIGEKEHAANKASFAGMMIDVNIEDTIKYIAAMMGVKQVKMAPIDNKTKYKHMTIPPDKGGFRQIFDFLQNKYGIYAFGFRHYFSKGILYVYPPFKLDTDRKPKLTVIRVSANSYAGVLNYHRIDENKDIAIISNSELNSQTLSNLQSENAGNVKLFVRSDGMIDGQVDKANGMKLKNMSATMSSKSDNSIAKDSAVPRYVESTLNIYGHASAFSESNTEVLQFGWPNARLDLLEPGMPVSFTYDEKAMVLEKKGILESVNYQFETHDRKMFYCLATIAIRSDPKAVPYEQ